MSPLANVITFGSGNTLPHLWCNHRWPLRFTLITVSRASIDPSADSLVSNRMFREGLRSLLFCSIINFWALRHQALTVVLQSNEDQRVRILLLLGTALQDAECELLILDSLLKTFIIVVA